MKETIEYENIGRYFSQMYRKGRIFYAHELKKFGLGSGQSIFLFQLYKKDGVTQDELANTLYIDKGTTARSLKTLENQGFIKKENLITDKRSNIIYLTPKALKLEKEITNILRKWDSILSSSLSEEEKNTLLVLLKKISDSNGLK
ncbi:MULTISPECIES: MarR family winged helix-turn-helix transcriptional regulator [Cetobacterium]|uniref:MarR family winged helix-turn-helix transcriptional regulator n=1 Tax=Candidatus Cetobacterium colombiensis TaxID=3073100 RepID=A0ABU4W936_9FUSO|nr:MarR family winged helix-turn-helix transcriptional regulator [Candidatus Cetobacterium colombiensis]MDX8336033.1 MarR family winged helix-turn-helix transcriptional regulator [Candidatus Cetobacterium colombiensis]